MATSKEYADFVCEHMEPFGTVSSRKMFGEYMVYIDGKAVLSVCDNTAFVKGAAGARRIDERCAARIPV